jgi:hypothetical protein
MNELHGVEFFSVISNGTLTLVGHFTHNQLQRNLLYSETAVKNDNKNEIVGTYDSTWSDEDGHPHEGTLTISKMGVYDTIYNLVWVEHNPNRNHFRGIGIEKLSDIAVTYWIGE